MCVFMFYARTDPSTGTPRSMERGEVADGVSKSVAVIACAAMAVFYVAVLYAPTLILRLPPPTSYKSFLIRRFVCAAVSSVVSIIASAFILPIRWHAHEVFDVFGIRSDHLWQAMVFPLSLTSLMYAGSFIEKFLRLLDSCDQHQNNRWSLSINSIIMVPKIFIDCMFSMASNISAWRNYIVAPLTEELVFRACMIPLLLCGGFGTYTAVFLCPVFFSLAHLNHMLEFYTQQNYSLRKTSMAVGFQLGYTVIFGSYASFIFVRTGHLIAPLGSHMFCNYMGLPVIFSRRTGKLNMPVVVLTFESCFQGMVTSAFIAGLLGFMLLLFPLTSPQLYNDRIDGCRCWHRFCILS